MNAPIRLVVFDLDGTLVDGYAAIEDALGWAMGRMGFIPPSSADVRRMVGEGLEKLPNGPVHIAPHNDE